MNNLLIKLREQLVSIIETIDTHMPKLDDVIIISKGDMKDVKWIKKNDYDRNLFEYKGCIRFTLSSKGGGGNLSDQKIIYDKIMDGTIERIVLEKLRAETDMSGILINYRVEDWQKTKLRDNYSNGLNQ
jgi:hypothetical protein